MTYSLEPHLPGCHCPVCNLTTTTREHEPGCTCNRPPITDLFDPAEYKRLYMAEWEEPAQEPRNGVES